MFRGISCRPRRGVAILAACCTWAASAPVFGQALPETVHFMSRDGATRLTGYLYHPAGPAPYPAIVMLHGRAGPYSSLKRGAHRAESLSLRHRMWGEFWSSRGYVALHVDSFGPRGYGDGFPKHSYASRPPEVSEQTVRPLDAYGALDYLRARVDVIPDRVALQGWSNGGMTVLAAMAADAPGLAPGREAVFRAAIALYPGCTTQLRREDYRLYAPLLLLAAADDDEVSPANCRRLAERLQGTGEIEFVLYEGAHHAYDDPGKTKQRHVPNHAAMLDTLERAERFLREHLQ